MVPVLPVLEKKESKDKIISLLNILPDKIDVIEGNVEEKDVFFEFFYKSFLKNGFPKKSYSGILSIKENGDEEFFTVSLEEKLNLELYKHNLSKFKPLDKKKVNVDLYLTIHPSTEFIVNNFSNKVKKNTENTIYLHNIFAYVDINNKLVVESFVNFPIVKTNDGTVVSKFQTLDFLGDLISGYSGFFMVTSEILRNYEKTLHNYFDEEKFASNKTWENISKEIIEKNEKINSQINKIRKEAKELFHKLQETYYVVFQDFVDDLTKMLKVGVKK